MSTLYASTPARWPVTRCGARRQTLAGRPRRPLLRETARATRGHEPARPRRSGAGLAAHCQHSVLGVGGLPVLRLALPEHRTGRLLLNRHPLLGWQSHPSRLRSHAECQPGGVHLGGPLRRAHELPVPPPPKTSSIGQSGRRHARFGGAVEWPADSVQVRRHSQAHVACRSVALERELGIRLSLGS